MQVDQAQFGRLHVLLFLLTPSHGRPDASITMGFIESDAPYAFAGSSEVSLLMKPSQAITIFQLTLWKQAASSFLMRAKQAAAFGFEAFATQRRLQVRGMVVDLV